MHSLCWLLILVATVAATACGDDTTGGTSPSPPGTFTITPQTDFLTIGSSAVYQAQLTQTGTAPRIVAADWRTDEGRIAAVDRSGRVSALASGSTTVRASFEGLTATLDLRVAPDYAGIWAGQRRVTSCSHPVPRVCQTEFALGSQFQTRLTLTQTRDRVTGTLLLFPATAASLSATLTGTIAPGGQLSMAGPLASPSTSGSVQAGTIEDWRADLDPAQRVMRGTFTELRIDPDGTTWRLTWELVDLSRQ